MTSWASLSELVLVLKDPSWQVQLLLLGICAGLTIILYKRNNHAGTDHRVTNEAPSHLQDHEKSKENKVTSGYLKLARWCTYKLISRTRYTPRKVAKTNLRRVPMISTRLS